MPNLVENLAQYLEDNAIGTVATDIFIGGLIDLPDNQISINQTGGVEPNRENPIKQPTVQILVRNTDYGNAITKATAVYDLLHQINDSVVLEAGGVDVMTCFALQEPAYLLLDESNRHIFTCNFVFTLRGSD